VHPLVMGLEEHLLTMFRDDFEFSDSAGASHLHGHGPAQREPVAASAPEAPAESDTEIALALAAGWTDEATRELGKIPFFVRGKAKRNTEKYADEMGLAAITLDTLYEAKAHYAR